MMATHYACNKCGSTLWFSVDGLFDKCILKTCTGIMELVEIPTPDYKQQLTAIVNGNNILRSLWNKAVEKVKDEELVELLSLIPETMEICKRMGFTDFCNAMNIACNQPYTSYVRFRLIDTLCAELNHIHEDLNLLTFDAIEKEYHISLTSDEKSYIIYDWGELAG